MKPAWLLLIVLLNSSQMSIAGGIGLGSGGDWRATLLMHAKRNAANWTNSIAINMDVIGDDDQLQKNSIAYRFISQKGVLIKLSSDIMTSEHIYNTEIQTVFGEYTSCAWTSDPRRAKLTDIVFSLKLCEGGLIQGGQNYANRLMIHESVHHLLLDHDLRTAVGANFYGDLETQQRREDEICDEIAAAIQRAFEKIVLQERTHWQDIANPDELGPDRTFLASRGYHAGVWTGNTGDVRTASQMIVWGGCNQGRGGIVSCGDNGYLGDGAIFDVAKNSWKLMSNTNAPSPRAEASHLWTDTYGDTVFQNQLVIWGGCVNGDGCEKKLDDGAFYDPLTDKWSAISSSPQSPAARVHHSMIWTGEEIIVWGGHPQDVSQFFAKPLNDGATYNPQIQEWNTLPPAKFADGTVFAARGYHQAFWTGATNNPLTDRKMLIWGGCIVDVADRCPQALNDGAIYDPKSKTWQKLLTTGHAPIPRHRHSALYVESQQKIYIFGGFDTRGNVLADGSVLDLNTLVWTALPNTAEGRVMHSAVWAGDKMLLFGGLKAEVAGTMVYEKNVTAYIPSSLDGLGKGSWQTVSTDNIAPLATIHHSTFWTGDSMLVWGGQMSEQQFTNRGSRFFLNLSNENH